MSYPSLSDDACTPALEYSRNTALHTGTEWFPLPE